MIKTSFCLPQPVRIPLPKSVEKAEEIKIIYYSDAVFNPFIYDLKTNQIAIKDNFIEIDFTFLEQATQQMPKIFDNIGVLRVVNSLSNLNLDRYGILITKQMDKIFASLID